MSTSWFGQLFELLLGAFGPSDPKLKLHPVCSRRSPMIIISHSCAHRSTLNVNRSWWSWSELVWPILQCRAPWDLTSHIIPAWGGREGRLAAPSVRSMLPPSGAADSPVIFSDRWLSAGSGPWLIRAGNEMRDFGCRSAYFIFFNFFFKPNEICNILKE